jgi:hypothetical protein
MPRKTNLALFSWMKLMLSEEEDFPKVFYNITLGTSADREIQRTLMELLN